MVKHFEISSKGKRIRVPSWKLGDSTVIARGNLIKISEIFDEYWIELDKLPDPEHVIEELRKRNDRPDVFSFSQRIPDIEPKFNYHFEWENYAVLPVSTYENWFQKQISSATRRNIRASEKRGVTIQISEFDDNYIKGIMSIYNESPVRQGRKYSHYGKDFETVKKENGTYSERSTFFAAYHKNEMIGYQKIVWDRQTAAIMQILSKMANRDSRPNNAFLSEAVRQCCNRGVKYLLYEKFTYGKKTGDSLSQFKENNGFIRMDVPRYYVPLTIRGMIAIRLKLYKNIKERLPEQIMKPLRNMRSRWYERKNR
ncbi:MAG TPA: GNAT family N-acetyltransferase [Syntrophorhabdus sp.]|nr:GNAT family N-acetyltransferase [Syntrophorhabdus sp.]